MEREILLNRDQLAVWAALAGKGIANAMSGLSQMTGQEIRISALTIRRCPAKDVPDLFGGPETYVVGIYLTVYGDASGHIVLVYQPEIALALIDMLMGNAPGTTQKLEEMEESALAEVGNITGSFFLNSLSDSVGLSFRPSPPQVVVDMIGAILDIPLSAIMQKYDQVSVVEAAFGTDNRQIKGSFLAIPTAGLLEAILKHC